MSSEIDQGNFPHLTEAQELHRRLVDASNTLQDHRNETVEIDPAVKSRPLTLEQGIAYAGFIGEVGKVIKAKLGMGNN